jgi:hypothetical protein
MRITEADLARIKLESEGIPCLIRDSASAVANSFIVTDVPVLVRAEDLERAKEALARPADDSMEGEYVDEDYRCPKCHRRDAELLPPSSARQRLFVFWVALIAVPIVGTIIRGITGSNFGSQVDAYIEYSILPWFLAVLVMGVMVATGNREKRCKACGYRWWRASSSPASLAE